MLSHEIAHVLHRDWARRYLYRKALEGSGAAIALGEPLASDAWMDPSRASEELI